MRLEELLKQNGWLVYKIKGVSMLPMLHQNRDLVVISVPKERLKKYDVALYKRGQAYVLHRVIGVRDWGYEIRGDNTYSVEKVPEESVIGVLTSFIREGNKTDVTDLSYRIYARLWTWIYPLRAAHKRCFCVARRAARRLGITKVIKKILRR